MSLFDDDDPESCICPDDSSPNDNKCGEYETLRIMQKFKRFYEQKLEEIDTLGGGDCLELKLKVQQKWIEDLTEQTEMMARIVKELEDEATDRVKKLEDKLRKTSKYANELENVRQKKVGDLEEKICCLECERDALKSKLEEYCQELSSSKPCVMTSTACTMVDDDMSCSPRERHLESALSDAQCKIGDLECKCKDLENTLKNSKDRADNLQRADCKCPSKNEVKKLRQAKRCYEHVIDCFKQEMAVMSEQLIHLQEILNLSNQSCKEENSHLYSAISDLQNLCDRLNNQLQDSEKQALLENQMNQLKDAKIEELQQIIGQKNAELNLHDDAINDMKCKLENSVFENHELQTTIVALNSKVMQLQCTIKDYEVEKSKKVEKCASDLSTFQKSICDFRDDLHKKNKKLEKLQCDYRAQHEMFKMAQAELEKNREKNRVLKKQVEELKKKLAKSEMNNQNTCEEFSNLQQQMTQMAQRECCREQELTQYKQMAIELRQTLIELNESLAESHVDKMCMAEEIMRKKALEERQKEDLYLSCRCEIALYRKLAENFKKSLSHSEKRYTDLHRSNKSLTEEVRVRNMQIVELQKKLGLREQEMTSFAKEANEKMKRIQEEKKKLCETLEFMKAELQRRMNDKSRVQLMKANEEVNTLRNEIKNMIQNQLALNAENDKLLAQVTRLQSLITPLEDKNRILIQKLENLTDDKEKLKEELRELDKANKEIKEASENIEAELVDTKTERDEMCEESKCVLNAVRLWLEEQTKINSNKRNKAGKIPACSTFPACSTMVPEPEQHTPHQPQPQSQNNDELLREAEMEYVKEGFFPRKFRRDHSDYYNKDRPGDRPIITSPNRPVRGPVQRYNIDKVSCQYRNPWNLGSQGTDSLVDRDSPRDSPTSFATCSVDEWYSPNYRDEDETDYQEEEFIRRIEAMTNDLRNSNKKLKNKCKDCRVSKQK